MSTFTFRKDAQSTTAFSAKANAGNLTLDLMDCIGTDMFGCGITASTVSDALSQAGEVSGITLNINSPGGDLFQGVAIYNVLKASGKPVTINVVGLAASAASLIAMAGDTITMQLGTQMMVHRAMAMTAGFSDDMRKMADTLDSVSASAADLYVARTGLAKDKVLALMAAETWMSPEDAVAQGFATSVSKQAKSITNSFDLSAFRNVPAELKTKTKEVDGEHLTADCFIYVGNVDEPEQWALPWKFSTEAKTVSHLRDALARFDQDKIIPASERPAAHAKLVKIAKDHGIDVSDSDPKNETEDFLIPILRRRLEMMKARK